MSFLNLIAAGITLVGGVQHPWLVLHLSHVCVQCACYQGKNGRLLTLPCCVLCVCVYVSC
jgi:hypothetical protein